MASSGGDNAEDKLEDDVAHVAGNEGESHYSRDDPPRSDHFQDDSVKYIGTIRKCMRKTLPHLTDLKLLRFLGGKVRPHILVLELGRSSSSSEA